MPEHTPLVAGLNIETNALKGGGAAFWWYGVFGFLS
jgi:hypothetical protein